jgi:hypothetical protein
MLNKSDITDTVMENQLRVFLKVTHLTEEVVLEELTDQESKVEEEEILVTFTTNLLEKNTKNQLNKLLLLLQLNKFLKNNKNLRNHKHLL